MAPTTATAGGAQLSRTAGASQAFDGTGPPPPEGAQHWRLQEGRWRRGHSLECSLPDLPHPTLCPVAGFPEKRSVFIWSLGPLGPMGRSPTSTRDFMALMRSLSSSQHDAWSLLAHWGGRGKRTPFCLHWKIPPHPLTHL